jgi:hypothetical protein
LAAGSIGLRAAAPFKKLSRAAAARTPFFGSKTKVLDLEFNFLDLGFVLFDEVAGSGNNFMHPYTF